VNGVNLLAVDTRAVRREATRARIVEAAWALARRDGLAGISLRELAACVGMRAPALYKYFPSKNGIYDAMYAEGARQLGEALARRKQGKDPKATLRNRVHAMVEFCVADPLRYQLLWEHPVPGFEPTRESYRIALTALAATRADVDAAGVHGDGALDLMRAITVGLVSLQVANDPTGDRWTRLLDEAMDMFLAHYASGG
jgi:AcrR family transcriptional regulator